MEEEYELPRCDCVKNDDKNLTLCGRTELAETALALSPQSVSICGNATVQSIVVVPDSMVYADASAARNSSARLNATILIQDAEAEQACRNEINQSPVGQTCLQFLNISDFIHTCKIDINVSFLRVHLLLLYENCL